MKWTQYLIMSTYKERLKNPLIWAVALSLLVIFFTTGEPNIIFRSRATDNFKGWLFWMNWGTFFWRSVYVKRRFSLLLHHLKGPRRRPQGFREKVQQVGSHFPSNSKVIKYNTQSLLVLGEKTRLKILF